jgi:hypothetical protein
LKLALHLMANDAEVSIGEVIQLKLRLALEMGFRTAHLQQVTGGTSTFVELGDLYEFMESAHPCITPVLKLLDAYVHVRYPLSAIGIESAEEDVVIKGLIGQIFVDLVTKTIASAADEAGAPMVPQRLPTERPPEPWRDQNRDPAPLSIRSLVKKQLRLSSLPYTTLRSLIESAIVIINKVSMGHSATFSDKSTSTISTRGGLQRKFVPICGVRSSKSPDCSSEAKVTTFAISRSSLLWSFSSGSGCLADLSCRALSITALPRNV